MGIFVGFCVFFHFMNERSPNPYFTGVSRYFVYGMPFAGCVKGFWDVQQNHKIYLGRVVGLYFFESLGLEEGNLMTSSEVEVFHIYCALLRENLVYGKILKYIDVWNEVLDRRIAIDTDNLMEFLIKGCIMKDKNSLYTVLGKDTIDFKRKHRLCAMKFEEVVDVGLHFYKNRGKLVSKYLSYWKKLCISEYIN